MIWLYLAAKQEAFEESIRLKNQFRTLDEDEVEFLDSILESTRAKEDAVKRETTEQLELFRQQQEEADKARLSDGTKKDTAREAGSPTKDPSADSSWAINARKRKRNKDNEVKSGLKLRKSSSTSEKAPAVSPRASPGNQTLSVHNPLETAKAASNSPLTTCPESAKDTEKCLSPVSVKGNTSALGLAAYSSDEDE